MSDVNHSGASGVPVDSVGARHNKPHVNGATKHAAPSVKHFKVDPPKPFDSKMLDGTALES